jgi:6-phosphogluconolactonase
MVSAAQAPEKMLVFIGTYTGGDSKGIYAYELSMKDGSLRELGLAAEIPSPSFLAIHPNRKFLYAVNEVPDFEGKKSGSATAFAIERDGKLKQLNAQSSGGPGPCHVVVDHAGKNLLLANYGGGSVAVLPIQDDGHLSPASSFIQHTGSSVNVRRQKEPHAHSINVDKQNRFAIAADLGLDKLLVYRYDAATGRLEANDPAFASVKAGSGPRHFAFHPGGRSAYVINEILSTVTAFAYDADKGKLSEIQTISTLPEGWTGENQSTAEIQVHPTGEFVYGSNRGHDSIVVFKVADASGKLTYVENESTQGKTPRNFGIDPTGAYLIAANQQSDSLVVFRIDQNTGALTPTGTKVSAPKPVCVKFLAQ